MEKKTLLNKKCDQQQKLNGYNGVWKGGSGWQKKNQKGGILLKGMGGEKMESGSSSSFQMFEYNYALTQRVITSLVLASAAAIKGWRVFVVVGAKKESFLHFVCPSNISPNHSFFSGAFRQGDRRKFSTLGTFRECWPSGIWTWYAFISSNSSNSLHSDDYW